MAPPAPPIAPPPAELRPVSARTDNKGGLIYKEASPGVWRSGLLPSDSLVPLNISAVFALASGGGQPMGARVSVALAGKGAAGPAYADLL